MARRTWVVSDTHFGHAVLVQPTTAGRRPWATVAEHDATLIEAWNAVVHPSDRVYHLGDVAINRRHVATLARCHGRKKLVKGNHDLFSLRTYVDAGVEDVLAYRVYPNTPVPLVLSHIPLHPQQLERFPCNVHGHMHWHTMDDPRYRNVCVEHTAWAPVLLDQLIEEARHVGQ